MKNESEREVKNESDREDWRMKVKEWRMNVKEE